MFMIIICHVTLSWTFGMTKWYIVTSSHNGWEQKDWPEGYQMASAMNFKFPQFTAIPLESIVPNCNSDGITLLTETLYWNPAKRPTTSQILRCSYFRTLHSNNHQSSQQQNKTSSTTAASSSSTGNYKYSISTSASSIKSNPVRVWRFKSCWCHPFDACILYTNHSLF